MEKRGKRLSVPVCLLHVTKDTTQRQRQELVFYSVLYPSGKAAGSELECFLYFMNIRSTGFHSLAPSCLSQQC